MGRLEGPFFFLEFIDLIEEMVGKLVLLGQMGQDERGLCFGVFKVAPFDTALGLSFLMGCRFCLHLSMSLSYLPF